MRISQPSSRKLNIHSPQARGLVSFWPMDNVAGVNLTNEISKLDLLVLTTSSILGVSALGKSINFRGSSNSDYAITSTSINHNIGTGDFTVVANVVRPTSSDAGYFIRSVLGFSNYNPVFGFGNGTSGIVEGSLGMYWGGFFDFGKVLPICVPCVVSYSRKGTTVSASINGIPCPNSTTNSSSISNSQIVIGRSGVTYDFDYICYPMNGIRLYNRCLTYEEIFGIYTNPEDLWIPPPKKIIYSIPASGFKPYFVRPQTNLNI
jgi:hypothetical protein